MDLNADLGESFGAWTLGDDLGMLDVVSSANVACGFHAGDPLTLLRTVTAAADRGVSIGAQVGYPDLVGFGRRFLDIEPAELTAAVLYQIGALDGLCQAAGTRVGYVKPHGALYHAVTRHEGQATALVDAVRRSGADLPLLGLPGTLSLRLAEAAGIRAVSEAFADRGYLSNGGLVPRAEPGAVLTEPATVAARAVRMVTDRKVRARDGADIPLSCESICLHGDTAGAVALARAVRSALESAGVTISPFVKPS